ncbi:MAG: ABC transporter permease [Spirochaetia bacterium]|jgi:simple sugar transport system permease protein
MMQALSTVFTPQLLEATIRLSTPVTLASIGAMVCERTGVTNIAMEGIMLVGAFFAAAVGYATGSPWLGLLGGIAGGMSFSLLFGWAAITLHINHVVAGAIMNILAFGFTRYFMNVFYHIQGTSPAVPVTLHHYAYSIPFLGSLPVVGPAFFNQTPIVYLSLVAVIAWAWILSRTRLGLSVLAAGEHPMAYETLGRSVTRIRYFGVLMSGLLCGIAGSFLSIENSNSFTEGMTDGRGFIALAANIAGGWRPLGCFLSSFFFGFVDALQLRVQSSGLLRVPSEVFLVFPYIATIAAVAGLVRGSRPPAAVGKDFTIEEQERT